MNEMKQALLRMTQAQQEGERAATKDARVAKAMRLLDQARQLMSAAIHDNETEEEWEMEDQV